MKKISIVFFVFVMFFNSSFNHAQSACCGLDMIGGMLLESGIYGGYGVQQFSATGFNDYIKVYNQNRPLLTKQMDEFGMAQGWRVGANVLQIQDDNILYGFNIFYQQTQEKHDATATLTNNISAKREYALTLFSYGIGMSFSYILSNSFDFKIADVKINWNKAKLVNKYTEGTNPSTEQVLKNPEANIGGQISTGIVYYPFPPYVSLEANVGYSYFTIDEMQFESGGQYLSQNENSGELMDNFIDGGGFFAFAHLNIAIPIFQ
ncbi:MAG: hypothetical protein WAU11_02745 [Ignavibacteriaceae bacterium]